MSRGTDIELRKKEVDAAVHEHLVDEQRYLRFRAGESIAEIALVDQITPQQVRVSLRNGRSMYEGEQILHIRDLKMQSTREAELIRQDVRLETAKLIPQQIKKLLEGKRTVASIDKKTGEIIIQEYEDPDVISLGLEHARKIMELDTRPAPNQTIVNVQHNQQTINEGGGGAGTLTYEDRLRRIRTAQQRTPDPQIYDVKPIESTDPDPPATPSGEWEEF